MTPRSARPSRRTPAALSLVLAVIAACASPGPTTTPATSPSASGAGPAPTGTSAGPTATGGEPSATSAATPSTTPSGPTATPQSGILPLDRLVVTTTPFVDGLDSPVFVTHAGDGTGMLYVVEQGGRILVVAPDGSVADQPFLDIGERIVAGGERGLLGLAFHPDYPSDDRFFVMYTAADAGANTVAEFHARDGAADPASERVLLSIADFAGNHNGGMVAFGPDGYLYAGTGDGGGGGDPEQNGQDSHALLGKILRIDVDGEPEDGLPYAIPADNPARLGMDFAPEVWALGLRNPWRFSFDREIGNLWIGDVGQNAWEEIDATPIDRPGLNFGWNIMEGPACYDTARCDETGLALPVSSYELLSDECAVIGGYVYRGEAVPEAQGVYLFGDYCDGRIRGLDAAAAIDRISGQEVDLLQTEATLSAFGEDEAGESYAVDLNGSILRIGLSLRD